MSLAAALIFAAVTAAAPVSEGSNGRGAQFASAEARATIIKAVVVRQASGVQEDRDLPQPQITHRGRIVLVEFQ